MKTVLVSRCLLGENVRYDGGNCLSESVASLKEKFRILPTCPELMAGMSVPRDPIELLAGKIVNKAGVDITSQFDPVLEEIRSLIIQEKVEVAILKEYSPSCGVHQIYDGSFSGTIIQGQGIVTSFIRSLGVKVISESEVAEYVKSIMP